ncbi:Zinc ion binding / nucleic acid binding protein [Hirschfeldia incana]|nr:Zinc ion binding / nucleic acid binding protein [Hirschfeldia incana]
MEFRYRAIDVDRPPPVKETTPSQSLNPNYSFFSALPIPGCNIRPRVDYVQRDIEKEQIRREIIAAEAARRRELIAEVAQEMAIEREMAIKSIVEKEEKITTWVSQRKLSTHQTHNNFSKLKRTYSDPGMYTSPKNLVTSPMTQMPPLKQMLGDAEAKETPLFESNKDKLIILDRPDPIGEDTQTRLRRSKRKAKDVEGGLNEPCNRKKLFKFWCDLCSVGACSETVMRNHEFGKKHKAAVIKKQAETAALTSPASLTAPQSEAVTVVANKQRQKVDEGAAKETGKKIEGEKKKTVIIRCETCNVVTYSENVMETHKLGKKHKAMLKKHYSEQLLETHRLEKKASTVPVKSLDADPSEEESMVHFLGESH